MSPGKRQGERLALIGLLVQAVVAGSCYWLATRVGGGEASFLWQCGHLAAASTGVAGLAVLHAYLRRLALVEEAEEAAGESRRQLFDNELDGIGRHRQACSQFERRLLPVLVGAVALALAAGSLAVMRGLAASEATVPETKSALLTAAAVLAVLAVISFVVGKFVNGVAFGEKQATLRPVGGELLLLATVAVGATLAALMMHWEQPVPARGYGWLLAVLGVMLGVERIGLLIVDAYRPQQRTGPEVLVYESRLLGVFTQPEGVVRNLAEIIRYQFGIKLDERALGNFLKRVLLPFVGAQALVLAALSTLVYVQPHETALVQGASRAELEVLEPGLYWRLPWPLTRVQRVPSGRLQTVSIIPAALAGEAADEPVPLAQLWVDERLGGELFLAASAASGEGLQGTPVNLAAAVVDVRFRVVDPRAHFTGQGAPVEVLRVVSRRELSRYLLENDLPQLMAAGRSAMATGLRERIEAAAQARNLGVAIESVGVRALQPPPQVAAAWDGVMQARADAGRLLAEGEAYGVRQRATADGTASTLKTKAAMATVRATKMAEAEAAVYTKMLPVHAAYPELLETRAAMDAIEVWLADARKVIIASEREREVITLELKKARPDLLEGFDQ